MTKKKKKRRSGLNGVSAVLAPTKAENGGISSKQLGISFAAALAGNMIGSIIFGKHVLLPSLALAGIGIARKNLYFTAAGAGMILSQVFPSTTPAAPATTNGIEDGAMEGIDFKQITDGIKDRAGSYFNSFKEKLYLPAPKDTPANGLNGNEKVDYFLSPSDQNLELDMSELDKVHQQVEMMNGFGEMEMMDRNF